MKTAIFVVHGSLKNYNRWNSLSSSELSTVSIKFRDISQGFFFSATRVHCVQRFLSGIVFTICKVVRVA